MDMTTAVIVGAGIALLCYKLGQANMLERREPRRRNTNEIYMPPVAPEIAPEPRRVIITEADETEDMPLSTAAYIAAKDRASTGY